ncbi:MAG: hypothetical protein MJ154_02555 [Candidatus Saccharibacteria bacterium]|nr:hypothetical protein [Candidatus Saccharibacteria bacterium]
MQKRKQLQYAVVGVLGFALLFMTIGFAAYAQLVSNDTASAVSRKYNVNHNVGFEADSYLQSEDSATPSSKTIGKNKIDFSVTLEHPGDTYAALINVVNNGDVAETLSGIVMTGLDESIADKIDYRISYDDVEYNGTSYSVDNEIETGDGARKQLFIVVEYKDGEDVGALNLDLSASLMFKKD